MQPGSDARAVLIHDLKQLHAAELKIANALQKMAHAAASNQLRVPLSHHLSETAEHAVRLAKVAKELDPHAVEAASPPLPVGAAVEGLLQAGTEAIEINAPPVLKDLALIAAAQKVEQFEIATYTALLRLAQPVVSEKSLDLLKKTLAEETTVDALLATLSGELQAGTVHEK